LIEAIVFDFDGLIIDTETPEFESWQDIFQSYGVTLARDLWETAIGRHSKDFDIYEYLADLSGERIEREIIRPKMRRNYLERIERNPVLPGVEECLLAAKRMALKLAVASSSSPGWAAGHLEGRGLLHYFEFVLDAGDVANAKPDPELYTMSAELLGVRPENALAIEDSANGLAAAKAAGMSCVVVPNPMTMGMAFPSADIRLESLADLPLGNLLDMLNGKLG
jgi:HAD superfamily hydrolase (TIGR01509 family)